MVDVPANAEAEFLAEEPYDASDPEQVNKARKKSARLERARLAVVEALMGHKDGRLYYWDLMESCHMFSEVVVMGDTHATYFQLGEQNIGKKLLADVQKFPELYVLMVKDAQTRK